MATMDRIGRYQILQELGRGAMGAVYKALDPQIDRTVAIKMILTTNLSPGELENYKQRFYREARAAGKMSHGGIVTIYDITEDAAGQPCLVMEFVEGRTLDSLMEATADASKPLPTARVLDVAIQVADALDYAHRRGVVHRDVKPANILLTSEGVAKIADFGIAKMEGVQLTQTGHMLGTPAFMSPEQFSGGTVDARSDLFSLGAILYWMLSGQKPFHAETLSMVTYKVVFADPPPATQVNPALPKNVDLVLGRCLAKRSEARYATCKDLAEDLRALVVGGTVKATALTAEELTVVTPQTPAAVGSSDLEKTVAQRTQEVERTVAAAERTVATPAEVQPAPIKPIERTVATPAAKVERKAAVPAKPAPAPVKKRSSFSLGTVLTTVMLVMVLLAGGAWLKGRFDSRNVTKGEPSAQPAAPPPGQQAPQESAKKPPESEKPAAVAANPPAQSEPASEPANETEKSASPRPGKGQGHKNRAPAVAQAKAILRIECVHNFRDGVLEISSDGQQILRASLRGEDQGRGIVKIYRGAYLNSLDLPAGEHVLEVRVRSSRSNFNESDQIGGAFPENGSRTLVVEFGRGSGIGVIGRKLTLRWK